MTTYAVRLATPDDGEELARLSAESFGYPLPEPPYRDPQAKGRTTYVITARNRLVATVRVQDYESWFWGSRIKTAGIASVAVAAEHRGNGLLTQLFDRALADAVTHGAAISTLFATAPGIYRRFGYETFATYDEEVALPTASLATVRSDGGSLDRGSDTDLPAIRDLYNTWASAHNGPLTRDGAAFRELPLEANLSLARDTTGELTGYALWPRRGGYGPDGVLDVRDLVALTDGGLRLLLNSLGTNASVAPTTRLCSSGADLIKVVLPGDDWKVRTARPYGLAVLDVASAFTARTYPTLLEIDLTFGVMGHPVTGQNATYRLRVSSGAAQCERTSAKHAAAFTPRGLALRFAGTHSNTDLRRAGFLTGDAEDSHWDVAFSGRQAHIRDYF